MTTPASDRRDRRDGVRRRLEVHGWPRSGREARATIELRTTVNGELGTHLTGTGGLRIEDTVVQPDGPAETLTISPRDLLAT